MRQKRSTLRLMLYGVLAGILCMVIWIEILNRWHLSKNLYLIYAGLLGMGAVYGGVGAALICGLLHLFKKARAQFGGFLNLSHVFGAPLQFSAAPKLYSNCMKPVALPPGFDRTIPEPTGSMTITNTIGTVRIACSSRSTGALPAARMTSGASATNSAADDDKPLNWNTQCSLSLQLLLRGHC